MNSDIIVIRGAGDLATGVIQKFFRCGFKLLVLETEKPSAIRRSAALCEAVYTGFASVEDVSCKKIETLAELNACYENVIVPILADPYGKSLTQLKPAALIDAILAKRNLGTQKGMAPITIALGPGFYAGKDVDAVIETNRGHDLGRLILNGSAEPNTGIPGDAGGKSTQRVIYAPAAGELSANREIGDIVEEGEPLCEISGKVVRAPFKGLLRGLIRNGFLVTKGLKIADIDPRLDVNWQSISDKARCIGGAALEAFLFLRRQT